MHENWSRVARLALLGLPWLLAARAAAPQAPPPKTVEGYIVTFDIKALAPELKTPAKPAPEAGALIEQVKQQTHLTSKAYLAQDLSRQEIQSTDFILPAGTLVMHRAGDRYYVIADPKQKTYVVMDSSTLLSALEGSAGIVNSAYDARVRHTEEKKEIAGLLCRKSIITVTYVSSIPFENDHVLVQQKNDIEMWHTSQLVSSAAVDHFFFKFQQDRTGKVRQVLAQEIGFPMEINFVVTSGAPGAKKASEVQPGSFHMEVTDVKIDKKLPADLFTIPPPEYRKVEKNPYFKETVG